MSSEAISEDLGGSWWEVGAVELATCQNGAEFVNIWPMLNSRPCDSQLRMSTSSPF